MPAGRIAKIATLSIASVVALAAAIFAWTYSWTFTEQGRMEYRAALLARLIDMQSQRTIVMTAESRAKANANTLRWLGERELAPVADIRSLTIPAADGREVHARLYTPLDAGDEPLPIYLMIHGGGFWMGDDFRIEEPQARLIAAETKAIVLAVDYRLAPEHPFPAGLDDCYTALLWIRDNAETLGADPNRIAVGGGSAGGNLSMAVALKARDEGGPPLRFLLPIHPVTDMSAARDTAKQATRQYVLKPAHMEAMRSAYVPDPAMRSHPYVSPLLAADHSGLPPTYIVTAQFDPLREQGEAMADKIRLAGGEVTHRDYPGVLHGFLGTPDIAQTALSEAAAAMREALW